MDKAPLIFDGKTGKVITEVDIQEELNVVSLPTRSPYEILNNFLDLFCTKLKSTNGGHELKKRNVKYITIEASNSKDLALLIKDLIKLCGKDYRNKVIFFCEVSLSGKLNYKARLVLRCEPKP